MGSTISKLAHLFGETAMEKLDPGKKSDLLRTLRFTANTLALFRFIFGNIPAHSGFNRSDVGGMTWGYSKRLKLFLREYEKSFSKPHEKYSLTPVNVIIWLKQ